MIDVDRVVAIDFHTHAEVARDGHDPMPPELREAAERYFRGKVDRPTADDVAAYYREREMACVVFTVDYETQERPRRRCRTRRWPRRPPPTPT